MALVRTAREMADLDRHVKVRADESLRPAARELFGYLPGGQGSSKLEFDLGTATMRSTSMVRRLAGMPAGRRYTFSGQAKHSDPPAAR